MKRYINTKVILGCLLALAIGILCRVTGVPSPAPVVLLGGILVIAMSVGYTVTDRYATHRDNRNRPLCGGPTGAPPSQMRHRS